MKEGSAWTKVFCLEYSLSENKEEIIFIVTKE